MDPFFAVSLLGVPHSKQSWDETVEASASEVASEAAIHAFVVNCTRNACGFGHQWFAGKTSATIRYQVYEPLSGVMVKSGQVAVSDLPQVDGE